MRRRVLYVQYTSPSAYPPLEHSSRVLAEADWDVLFLGVTKEGDPPLHWPARRGITVRELGPVRVRRLRKLHYAWFTLWVLAWAMRWRPTWIYASDVLACPVALLLSFWPGARLLYHEHDSPQVSPASVVGRLTLLVRRKLAERAAARVLPNVERAQHFSESVGHYRPTFSVLNCPVKAEVACCREPASGEGLQLLYVGSIVPARLPVSVIEALRLLPETVRLRVIGYPTQGHTRYVTELQTRAARLGITRRVQYLGGMPHPEALMVSRDADVGLALMSAHNARRYAQWMPGASNKPFDYMAAGLALLLPDEAGWRDMYVQPGYGLTCQVDDPHSIAAALRWFLEHPVELRAMGERGRRRVADEWNYECQFAPVLACLDAGRPT